MHRPERSHWRMLLPREHGAWATLSAGYLLGTLVGGRAGLDSLLLLGAALAALFARAAAVQALRLSAKHPLRRPAIRWALAYGSVSLLAAFGLALQYSDPVLLLIAIVALSLFTASLVVGKTPQLERSLAGELLGMAGLSLVAPLAEYVAAGGFSARTAAVWLLGLSFFSGSVLRVRAQIRPGTRRLPASLYHLGALALATGAALHCGHLPLFAPLALVPAFLFTLPIGEDDASFARAPDSARIRRVGFMELAHCAAFVALAALAFRVDDAAFL